MNNKNKYISFSKYINKLSFSLYNTKFYLITNKVFCTTLVQEILVSIESIFEFKIIFKNY